MLEQIWDGILKFTAQLVIPDWTSLIVLLPVFMGVVALLFFGRVLYAYMTAGPRRRGGGRVQPVTPPGVHMPGPTYAPVFGAIGTFCLLLGLVFGGPLIIIGPIVLVLGLLYWGREGLADYDHVVGEHPVVVPVVHAAPPPGVHVPGPSFLPLLAALGVAILFAGLVFGGWIIAVGVIFTIVALLGWLNAARKEYRQVVLADTTGHLQNEPAPDWPRRVFVLMAAFLVLAVALNLGWFPPRTASGGTAGASPGPSGAAAASGAPSGAPGALAISAQNIKFDVDKLAAPADKPFQVTFDNKDAGVAHDFDVLDASGKKVFDGQDFPGPGQKTYDVPALTAGAYKFECSIHPQLMFGVLTVGG
jgi:plastocyanin